MSKDYYLVANEEVVTAMQVYLSGLEAVDGPAYTLQYAVREGSDIELSEYYDVVPYAVLNGIKHLVGLELLDRYEFGNLVENMETENGKEICL